MLKVFSVWNAQRCRSRLEILQAGSCESAYSLQPGGSNKLDSNYEQIAGGVTLLSSFLGIYETKRCIGLNRHHPIPGNVSIYSAVKKINQQANNQLLGIQNTILDQMT